MRRALAALALALVLPLPALADVTVKPGETLGEIAERHGVSLNRLMQANGIKDPTQLQIGQRLVIPGRSNSGSGGRASGGSVVVQPGDTLSEIAERNGISLQRLMQLNGISNPAMVEAGRRLVLTGGSGGSSSSGASRGGGSANYTVKSGETLGEIAERYNTSVNRLMQLNGISDPTALQAGSRIVVPGATPARTASRPGSTTQTRNTKAREHVVQPGESLSEIADAYNLPLQKLVSLNNISDPNLLMSGTRLRLTAPPPVPASRPAPTPPKATAPKPKPAAKPTPAVAAQPKPKPAASTRPAPAAPATTTAPTPAPQPAAKPVTAAATPRPAAAPTTTATPATTATSATTTAAARPAPRPRPATATATTAKATTAPAPATATAKPAGPDWRSYGPLQVDWANWQPMGGSFVAPSLNAEGQPLYTAINCGARKLNATSQTGQWRTWEAPRTDAEQQLVNDLCKAKGS